MTCRFSICHPSYGRPRKARETVAEWLAKMTTSEPIEWILSVNDNDPTYSNYFKSFGELGVNVVSDSFNGMVAASNAASKIATGSILILVSDDMHPPEGWDQLLLDDNQLNSDKPCVLQIHDSIRDDIMTLPIMNRAAYDKLGYLYHPSYISMFADNDLAETAKVHNMYYRSKIVGFEHKHWVNGKAQKDATYERESSSVAWQLGQKVYDQRKAGGFQI